MQNTDYTTPALFIDGEWITEASCYGEVLNPNQSSLTILIF